MANNSFRQLNVYKESKELVKQVYALLTLFPAEEKYALCDQLRRAVISVPSNLAEGLSRTSDKEQVHFLDIAYGSLMEVQCQLDIATELGYLYIDQFDTIDNKINNVAKMISGLRGVRSSSPVACNL